MKPEVTFEAVLITRGGGTGAKRIMEAHPEIGEFIKTFTGWNRVEAGTLTLNHANPLPLPVLASVRELAEQPPDLVKNPNLNDARIMQLCGPPKYYAALATSKSGKIHRVVLSQQPRPAARHRLEVIADIYLRDALAVIDNDAITLAIFHCDEWESINE